MLADKYVFEQWDCPDTLQAAFRYPGLDVVYEGMMSSSIDDGGLEFRGTEATLKINRSGFGIYREGLGEQNPDPQRRQLPRRHHRPRAEFLRLRQNAEGTQRAGRNRNRRRACRPDRQSGLQETGQISWPPKNSA